MTLEADVRQILADLGFDRHLPGKHDQSTHGKKGVGAKLASKLKTKKPAKKKNGPPNKPETKKASFDDRYKSAKSGEGALDAAPYALGTGGLTENEEIAFESYKDTGYDAINKGLRGQAELSYVNKLLVQQMNGLLERSALPADVAVTRGILNPKAVWGDAADGDLTGAEWTEKAYVSTTTDPVILGDFSDGRGAEMRMLIPKGIKAVTLSGTEYESELMLQSGLKMRVVADSGPGTIPRRVDVEVVP